MKHFVVTRQQHLIDTVHAKSVQANTLLVTGIPIKYLSHEALYKLFRDLPGGVKKIWINRFVSNLHESTPSHPAVGISKNSPTYMIGVSPLVASWSRPKLAS
jgi:hypothetical protein